MWNNGKELKGQLVHLEKLKEGIMLQINQLNENKEAIAPTKVYPVSKVKLYNIHEYPVVQFNYEGLLPLYIDDIEYQKAIKNYYFHSTISAYDFEGLENIFEKEVVIIYCQHFTSNKLNDFDNRNFKYIQDAIRSTCLIADDNWLNVWNMNLAFKDDLKNHVQVYVVNRKDSPDFFNYLESNHDVIADKDNFPIDKEKFIKKFEEKNKGEKTENITNNNNKNIDFDSIIDVEEEWFGE